MALPMLLAASAVQVGLASPPAELQPIPLLTLARTTRRLPRTGDPIWDLRLQIPGEPDRHFDAVSGRADRQSANRDRMGSEAPLPVGSYRIGAIEPLGRQGPRELGPIWIGIEPEFTTGRRVLGIHLDPSAGRNWNSGTAGCIGLIRSNDMHALADLVRRSGTNTLVVAQ
ncbi:L,D-transpeptidase [Synechococcus sp. LA31]|uniref:L,D-transpeptidase n=1 Tax=Synechococcus sp. LA31 TaxID=2741953 RepID=UPI001BDDBE8B|nr:L,D-transpeptidase [Synechococcus sp. LA31]QVV67869.1 L,D-transpeptidase [Synechococcus sp. LA31]